jgi:topoisomerase-4 subunit A
MRLRSLRKLEEMEIKGEQKELSGKQATLKKLLKDEDLRWQHIDGELVELKKKFGKNTELGARRTDFADAPAVEDVPLEATIERENVTVVLSEKGWVRAMRGHGLAEDSIKYKEGDEQRFVFEAETTDKILLFATNGRFYTLGVDKLPGGRGSTCRARPRLSAWSNMIPRKSLSSPARTGMALSSRPKTFWRKPKTANKC